MFSARNVIELLCAYFQLYDRNQLNVVHVHLLQFRWIEEKKNHSHENESK